MLHQKTSLKVFTKSYPNIAVIDGFTKIINHFRISVLQKKMKDNVNVKLQKNEDERKTSFRISWIK